MSAQETYQLHFVDYQKKSQELYKINLWAKAMWPALRDFVYYKGIFNMCSMHKVPPGLLPLSEFAAFARVDYTLHLLPQDQG